MTARIIWIGKNNEMAVVPRSALSAGMMAAARPVVLPRAGRAAPFSPPARVLPARGNLGGSALRAAPLFDATAERWIVPPSTTVVDAVAPADQGSTKFVHPSLKLVSPVASNPAGETFREAVVEAITVALGLTVFGLVAGFFLVLA